VEKTAEGVTFSQPECFVEGQLYSLPQHLKDARGYPSAGYDTKGRIFVLGGWNRTLTCSPKDSLQIFDTNSSTFVSINLGDPPQPRSAMAVLTWIEGNSIVYFGGQYISSAKPGDSYNDVLILDTERLVIEQPELSGIPPPPRGWAVAELIGNKMWIFGGGRLSPAWTQAYLYNDVHVLDLESKSWSQPNITGEPPCPRAGHALAW